MLGKSSIWPGNSYLEDLVKCPGKEGAQESITSQILA
jgi:hypothetical protein